MTIHLYWYAVFHPREFPIGLDRSKFEKKQVKRGSPHRVGGAVIGNIHYTVRGEAPEPYS